MIVLTIRLGYNICYQHRRINADGSRIGAYKFYFYSHEPNEPSHIHVDRDNHSAKFWLSPVQLARNIGFSGKELRVIESHVLDKINCWRHGMGILALNADERVKNVYFPDEDTLSVDLMDGRTISVPVCWYPRLENASDSERSEWEVCGGGYGIFWEQIDEHLSTEGLLRGAPAPKSAMTPAA